MNKEEFLQALRRDLSGDVSPDVLEENMSYYREYIEGEVRKGRSEEEVVEEIGAPRLIAKNIEDTSGPDDEEERSYAYDSGYSEEKRSSGIFSALFNPGKWYGRLLILLMVILVLIVIFALIGGIVSLIWPVLEIVILLLVVCAVIRIFRGNDARLFDSPAPAAPGCG